MTKLYNVIAENGEHGLLSVTSYSTQEKAQKSLKDIAVSVINDFGVDTENYTTNIGENGALVDVEGFIIHINIIETVIDSDDSGVNITNYQNYYY